MNIKKVEKNNDNKMDKIKINEKKVIKDKNKNNE